MDVNFFDYFTFILLQVLEIVFDIWSLTVEARGKHLIAPSKKAGSRSVKSRRLSSSLSAPANSLLKS